jgi:exosome complex exonuclease DIS3/RRP44
MLKSKSFFRTTRKGNVVKVVREHYLRDDITCGVPDCRLCRNVVPKEERDNNPQLFNRLQNTENYIIPDTNVILHQTDLMENSALTNLIMLQTVLEEVKHQNMNIYKRIREAIQDESRHIYVFNNELLRYYQHNINVMFGLLV